MPQALGRPFAKPMERQRPSAIAGPDKNSERPHKSSGVRIGTSGWHYKHWKDNFYPAGINAAGMLPYYIQQFDTVEINNSFYRLPTEEAVKSWVQQTPRGFVFALKASRYITHNRKLKYPEETIAKFLRVADLFGKKLGPILFQLPPSWTVNRERLGEFLAALPRGRRYAFEFRNPTWHTQEVFDLLSRFNAAFCAFEIAGFQSPIVVTANFVYVRLHGPGGAYQGKYSHSSLRNWSKRIHEWVEQKRRVYVYFDNDQAGFAAQNAMELSQIVREGEG